MRKKLNSTEKRASIIGIKVKQELKDKIKFVSGREARTMSSQINYILENYIENYLKDNNIDWEEYAPQNQTEEGGE